MRDLARSFDDACLEGLEEGMSETWDYVVYRSSGPYSQPQLDAMDNPYAKRHGRPLLDPGRINVQTGAFRREWRDPETMRSGDGYSSRILNDSDVADFLRLGTRYMFSRPIGPEGEAYAEKATERHVARALRKWAKATH